MGQYYKPTILADDKKTPITWADSWDYGTGAKLMEHSWVGNHFVARIEVELLNNPQCIVWAGDYADAEVDADGNERTELYEGREYPLTMYSMADKLEHLKLPKKAVKSSKARRYILNHESNEFVDIKKVQASHLQWAKEGDEEWLVHPLPLLTAEGNNRGGGDYRSDNGSELVGSWARNLISIVTRKKDIPEHLIELEVAFKE